MVDNIPESNRVCMYIDGDGILPSKIANPGGNT